MGKEADMFFNVPLGTYFWTMEENEPLIIAFSSLLYHVGSGEGLGKFREARGNQGQHGIYIQSSSASGIHRDTL